MLPVDCREHFYYEEVACSCAERQFVSKGSRKATLKGVSATWQMVRTKLLHGERVFQNKVLTNEYNMII